MDDVFLFDHANSRFLTSEYLTHPLITKTPELMRSEQRVFYRARWVITTILLAALVAATVFLLIAIPTHMIAQYSSILTPIVLVFWCIIAYLLVGMVIRQFTQVYDPTHDIMLEEAGVVVLGEVQAIDWIKHRQTYWLTVRARYPGIPDTTLHTIMPTTGDTASQPQPGMRIALLYSGVWGTPFYKAEVL